jgi:Ca-activated chloride channel family protein
VIAQFAEALRALHLLRPLWLLALPVLAAAAWAWRRRDGAGAWESAVDPELRAHLLVPADGRRRWLRWWPWLGAALAIVALAGPAWRRAPQPAWEARAPLAIALDLSGAMLDDDLPPSRFVRARTKLATLLRERAGGQVGLLVYAGDAYTVAPMTDDAANVALFLDALAPDIMPGDEGARADAGRAIERASALLRQAGFDRGDILLVTGGAGAPATAAAARAAAGGYRVSVLDAAAPGSDAVALRALAAAGHGRHAMLSADRADLDALGVLAPRAPGGFGRGRTEGSTWRDDGYWLLLPVLLLAAFAFRRNGVAAVLVLCLLLPWRPAAAAGVDWWKRADQQAHRRLEQGTQAYRRQDYAGAEHAWRGLPGADAAYNLGNALAREGRYADAIAAYDEALRRQPGMADAIANRKAVEAASKRHPPPSPGRKAGDAGGRGGAGQAGGGGDQGARRDDARKQQAQAGADAAQAERMRAAVRRAGAADGSRPDHAPMVETRGQHERRLANQARLQRVPDDPGGLLRERLRLEYERRRAGGE